MQCLTMYDLELLFDQVILREHGIIMYNIDSPIRFCSFNYPSDGASSANLKGNLPRLLSTIPSDAPR